MGFKSKEIIIGVPLVLNELPKYWDKMIIFVTIGHEPFTYGTLILAFSSDIFFCQMLFIGDLTELPIPMNYYVVDEKKLKTNSLGFGCRMLFS